MDFFFSFSPLRVAVCPREMAEQAPGPYMRKYPSQPCVRDNVLPAVPSLFCWRRGDSPKNRLGNPPYLGLVFLKSENKTLRKPKIVANQEIAQVARWLPMGFFLKGKRIIFSQGRITPLPTGRGVAAKKKGAPFSQGHTPPVFFFFFFSGGRLRLPPPLICFGVRRLGACFLFWLLEQCWCPPAPPACNQEASNFAPFLSWGRPFQGSGGPLWLGLDGCLPRIALEILLGSLSFNAAPMNCSPGPPHGHLALGKCWSFPERLPSTFRPAPLIGGKLSGPLGPEQKTGNPDRSKLLGGRFPFKRK